jgi:UDP-galactopyranose mutase
MQEPAWKVAKTYSDAPHEYTLRHQDPAVFEWYRDKIKSEGRAEKFTLRGRTAAYRYYYVDGYKYWIIRNVLNRAKVGP